MAEELEILKILAQVAPSATTITALYTVPEQKRTQVHKLIICNRSGGAVTYRVAICPDGDAVPPAATLTKRFHYYDTSLAANASITVFDKNDPVYLYSGDFISIYASTGDLSFSLYGKEMFF